MFLGHFDFVEIFIIIILYDHYLLDLYVWNCLDVCRAGCLNEVCLINFDQMKAVTQCIIMYIDIYVDSSSI